MDELNKKKLEAFMDKLMSHGELESPSENFTQNLMMEIKVQPQKGALKYKPILSKWALTLITILFAVTLYLISTYTVQDGSGWFEDLKLGPYFNDFWSWLEFYTPSKVTLYAVLLFGFMFLAQIPWLKRHIERHGML